MAKETYRYFKLGPKSSIFYDSKLTLKITDGKPGKVLSTLVNRSKKTITAKSNGHIVEIERAEYEKLIGLGPQVLSGDTSTDLEKELNKLNKDQLFTHLVDSYEVSEEEKSAFKKKSKAEMITYLVDLEEDEE